MKSDFYYAGGGLLFRVVFQSLFFIGLANFLDVSEFGFYNIVIALSSLVIPFCGLGTQLLLVKKCSANESNLVNKVGFLSQSIKVTISTGIILSVALTAVYLFIYKGGNTQDLLKLFISEIVFIRIYDCFLYYYQGVGDYQKTMWVRLYLPLARFCSLATLWFFEKKEVLNNWVDVYCIVMLLMLVFFISLADFRVRDLLKITKRSLFDYKEGVLLSSSLLMYALFTSTDQLMIGYFLGEEEVGYYAFVAKIYLMIFLPFQALSMLTFRKFFTLTSVPQAALTYLYNVLRKCFISGLIIGLFLYTISEYVFSLPLLASYSEFRGLLIIFLCALPFKACSTILSDYLVSINYQKNRLKCESFVCILNVVLNFALIKIIGVLGATIATLVSEFILFILFLNLSRCYGLSISKP